MAGNGSKSSQTTGETQITIDKIHPTEHFPTDQTNFLEDTEQANVKRYIIKSDSSRHRSNREALFAKIKND